MLTFPVKGGGDFKGLPSGSYIAICDMVVFLGLQPGSGLYPDPKFQVYIRYQVPSERVEFEKDGKKQEGPCVIGQAFTASMHEAMAEVGFKLYNDFALLGPIGTLPVRIDNQFGGGRKCGNAHQYVLCYFRGNPAAIKQDFAELNQ